MVEMLIEKGANVNRYSVENGEIPMDMKTSLVCTVVVDVDS